MNWGSFWIGVVACVVGEVVLVIAVELYARYRDRDIGTYMDNWDRK